MTIESILTQHSLTPRVSRLLSDAACRWTEARIARRRGNIAKARRCYQSAHKCLRQARWQV